MASAEWPSRSGPIASSQRLSWLYLDLLGEGNHDFAVGNIDVHISIDQNLSCNIEISILLDDSDSIESKLDIGIGVVGVVDFISCLRL